MRKNEIKRMEEIIKNEDSSNREEVLKLYLSDICKLNNEFFKIKDKPVIDIKEEDKIFVVSVTQAVYSVKPCKTIK